MPKYKVLVQPSGLINGQVWPEAGETIELEEGAAVSMAEAGILEPVKEEPKTEKRPASTAKVEKR
jgi:hypothetical protein